MASRRALLAAVGCAFLMAYACVPTSSGGSASSPQTPQPAPAPAPPPPPPKTEAPPVSASSSQYEVLVQYRDDADEAQKAAVRAAVGGRLKERLDSPSGARNLEVLIVPGTQALDSMDRVIAALRRHKAVRIAEGQQTYTRQPSPRD